MASRAERSGFASQFTDLELRFFGADDSTVPRSRAAESLAARVAGLVGLRPLPEVSRHGLSLLGAKSVDLGALSALVEADVALAAKVVRFAATARAIPGTPVTSVRQAMERVGPRMLPGLVASALTDAPYPDADGTARALHLHARGVAAFARDLADYYGLADAEELYLCGLFHDVGRLFRLQAGEGPDLDDPEEETLRFGYDHAVLASEVLKSWHLPERVVRVVGLHHHTGRILAANSEIGVRTALVRLADRLEGWMSAGSPLGVAIEGLATDDGLSTYADFLPEDLESLWPVLEANRRRGLDAYPSRVARPGEAGGAAA